MRTLATILVLLLWTTQPLSSSPSEMVRAAALDCSKLVPEQRLRSRYLTMYHVKEKETLAKWEKGGAFWINALSTEVDLKKLTLVSPGLWRVDIGDYGWAKEVWEKLLEAQDPYFHVRLAEVKVEKIVPKEKVEQVEEWVDEPTGRRISFDNGRTWQQETRKVKRVRDIKKVEESKDAKKDEQQKEALAPHLPYKEMGELVLMTQTQIPLVRLDWFIHQVGAEEGRKAGYYNWVGVDKYSTFQDLGGTNSKVSRKLKLNLRAIVGRSTVTLNSREIEYEPALTGAHFRSNDFARSTDFKNPLRLLGGDAKPDAHEDFIRLGNGLWAVGLFNGAGDRIATAPDNIASDGKARGTDRRVHVGISCFRCHEGLQPVVNWAKTIYAPPFSLDSPEYKEQLRLRAEYLRDMGKVIDEQQRQYTEVLKGLNGLTPKENSLLIADLWDAYELADLDITSTAAELGVEEKAWKEKLTTEGLRNKRLDPVLAALYQGLPIRREHWEEVYALAQQIVRGL